GGRAVVRISSSRAINEPFVALLVELNWASGKFAREYTFLLDPPELQVGRANTVDGATAPVAPRVGAASPAPSSAPTARAAAAAQQAPTPVPAAAPPARPAVAQSPASTPATASAPTPARPASIEVGRGDTLAAIAEQVRPSGVPLNQAIVSIYRANPDAF